MHKVCTLVPTYFLHFDYALEILRTHNEFATDQLFFAFSSLEEENLFRKLTNIDYRLINKNKNYGYLIVPNFGGNGVINQKKIFGVNTLIQNGYDYVGVLDDESMFVKTFDSERIYSEIAKSKSFKSNFRNDNVEHLKRVADMMQLSDNKTLIKETDNFTQYWWFNEICVYDAKYFPEFFEWLTNHPNFNTIIRDFICFDYLLYSLWLIAFKKFKLDKKMQKFSFGTGAVETNWDDDNISYEFKSYADRNINHKNIDHIKIHIMLDRSEEFMRKSNNKKLINDEH